MPTTYLAGIWVEGRGLCSFDSALVQPDTEGKHEDHADDAFTAGGEEQFLPGAEGDHAVEDQEVADHVTDGVGDPRGQDGVCCQADLAVDDAVKHAAKQQQGDEDGQHVRGQVGPKGHHKWQVPQSPDEPHESV